MAHDGATPGQSTPHRPAVAGQAAAQAGPQQRGRHPVAPEAASPVPQASDAPGRWGRIDEAGTVFVRTAGGERTVGSWQAGSEQDGLAHFAMRFDDLRVEVELLHTRLGEGNGDPKQVQASARGLRDSLDGAAVVGDVDALAARLDAVLSEAERAISQAQQAREHARERTRSQKEALVSEAETIAAESTQWREAGDRLRAIVEEWKALSRSRHGGARPSGAERRADDDLWKRLSRARDGFNRRRGSHFADLDKQRAAAKERKQELVAEAESLADSTEWRDTAARLKQLMSEWKAAGRAPKDADDALWKRFRAATDAFFARRSEEFSRRDAELAGNATAKDALLDETEQQLAKLLGDRSRSEDAPQVDAARTALRQLHERWEEIGKVPRERMKDLEARLKAVESRVRTAADTQWRRTDPEAQARADQFRERVEQLEAQAEKARAAGNTRRAQEHEQQAAQWREWLSAAEEALASR